MDKYIFIKTVGGLLIAKVENERVDYYNIRVLGVSKGFATVLTGLLYRDYQKPYLKSYMTADEYYGEEIYI